MSDQETGLTEDFNDKDVNDFFEKGGHEEENDAAETENVPHDSGELKNEDQNAEIGDGEKSEEQPAKQMNDNDRFRAMAESERVKRKEIQKQIEDMRRENENLKSTFNRILTKAQEQAEADQKASVPSFEEDPITALRYENEQLKKKMSGFEDFQTRSHQASEAQQQQQQFVNSYRSAADEFAKTNPDFDDAYSHLMESRLAEFDAAGYTPVQARQLLVEDEAAIVANAMQRGINPAESIYKLAKLRGFSSGSNMNAQDKINANNEKINNLERGLQASRSVNSGGINSRESMSLESIAAMDDSDFENVDWNKVLKMG